MGDERLELKGTVVGPSVPEVDPVAKGLRLVVLDVHGVVIDALLPAGEIDFLTRVGWTVNAAGTSWTCRDPGKAAPAVAGIGKASLKRGKLVGAYRFAVLGKGGEYVVDAGAPPLRALAVLDPSGARTGQCGEAVFPGPAPGPSCAVTGGEVW